MNDWLHATTTRLKGQWNWKGVIKRGDETVLLCAHKHPSDGKALFCVAALLRAIEQKYGESK